MILIDHTSGVSGADRADVPVTTSSGSKGCGSVHNDDRRVELIAVTRLAPSKANARIHSRKQIRQIADSIKRFGFNNPVLIDDDGIIIAGHGRVEAARLLGMEEVPTLRLSHLSAAEQRAYIIADNRLAEKADWDRKLLAVELNALIDLDFDVELTGFEMAEVDLILEGAEEPERGTVDHEIREPRSAAPVSQTGDLWQLGEHLLWCGEANDKHIDAAIRRWQLATGKTAILEATGQCFEEVAQQRRKSGLPLRRSSHDDGQRHAQRADRTAKPGRARD